MPFKLAEAFVDITARGLSTVNGALGLLLRPITGVLDGLMRINFAIEGISRIGRGLGSLVVAPLKIFGDYEQTEIAFEVMLGDAQKAKDTLAGMRHLAIESPLGFTDMTQATKTLLGYGVAGKDVYHDIKALSEVASGSADKFQRLTKAFGDVKGKGRLTGEEIRQFVNASFNPLEFISKRTGEEMPDLDKRMRAGGISFEEVRQAFKDATAEGGRFYQMNEKQSKTLLGTWEKFKENIEVIMTRVGELMVNNLDIKGIIQTMTEWVQSMGDLLGAFSTNWAEAWDVMKLTVIATLQEILAAVKGFASQSAKMITDSVSNAGRLIPVSNAEDATAADPEAARFLKLMEKRDRGGGLTPQEEQEMADIRKERGGDIKFNNEIAAYNQEGDELLNGSIDWDQIRKDQDKASAQTLAERDEKLARLKGNWAKIKQADQDRPIEAPAVEEKNKGPNAINGIDGLGLMLGMNFAVGMAQAAAKFAPEKFSGTQMTDAGNVNRFLQEAIDKRQDEQTKYLGQIATNMAKLLQLEEGKGKGGNKNPIPVFGP